MNCIKYQGYKIHTFRCNEPVKKSVLCDRYFNPVRWFKYVITYRGKIVDRCAESFPLKNMAIIDAENRIQAQIDSL